MCFSFFVRMQFLPFAFLKKYTYYTSSTQVFKTTSLNTALAPFQAGSTHRDTVSSNLSRSTESRILVPSLGLFSCYLSGLTLVCQFLLHLILFCLLYYYPLKETKNTHSDSLLCPWVSLLWSMNGYWLISQEQVINLKLKLHKQKRP